MAECWVYKMYCTESRNGGLSYVGISDSPSRRMGDHESQKWWWWIIDNIEWERFYSRDDAKARETSLITGQHPTFNYQESQLSAWERMRTHVAVLWGHETNAWDCPPCPVCESHGRRNFMCPLGEHRVFVRCRDDQLVIHSTVSCPHHPTVVQWAQHCLVSDFLIAFGKCPRQDAIKLVEDAVRLGPVVWDDRLNRESTLLERIEAAGTLALSGPREMIGVNDVR